MPQGILDPIFREEMKDIFSLKKKKKKKDNLLYSIIKSEKKWKTYFLWKTKTKKKKKKKKKKTTIYFSMSFRFCTLLGLSGRRQNQTQRNHI